MSADIVPYTEDAIPSASHQRLIYLDDNLMGCLSAVRAFVILLIARISSYCMYSAVVTENCFFHGMVQGVALCIAFIVSAVFHELCIAVPCHLFKLWAFIGIMFQVPLVVITNYLQKKFKNSMVGNMIFWSIFCIVGQPMCVLLYYHDLLNPEGKAE